jgi:SAM-dependent methyltransferase
MSLDDTRLAYDRDPQREWRRLEAGARGRLEFLITMRALRTHLPPPGTCRVLDAGGGPGRYTIALAEAGYHVSLLDLSPKLIALARERIATLPDVVRSNVADATTGSITDLSRYPDGTFDAVLCLGGPLSHLIDRDDRQQAVQELTRVLAPQGTLVVSALGRLGAYRSAVQWLDWFDGAFPAIPSTGTTVISSSFVPAYFFLPGEIEDLVAEAGLTIERRYGCQGIGAHLDETNLLQLMDDPVRWPQWQRVLLETCDHPAIVGVSSHLLVVGRKQGDAG